MAGLGLMNQESALRTALALAAGDRSSASSSSAPQAATKQTSGIAKRQRAEAEIAARADGTGEEEEKTAGPAPWPPNVGIKGGKRQQEYVENIHDDLPANVDRVLGPVDSTEEVASLRTQTLCQESLDDTPMTNGSIVAALSTIMNINAGNIKEVIDMTTNDGDGKEVIDNSKKRSYQEQGKIHQKAKRPPRHAGREPTKPVSPGGASTARRSPATAVPAALERFQVQPRRTRSATSTERWGHGGDLHQIRQLKDRRRVEHMDQRTTRS